MNERINNLKPDNNFCPHGNFPSECSECAEITEKRHHKWAETLEQVNQIRDKKGMRVDEGIKELLTACMVNGFPVDGSCEGHLDRALAYPYIVIELFTIPKEKLAEIHGKSLDEAEKILHEYSIKDWAERQRIKDLLQEFYSGREIDPRYEFEIHGEGVGLFRLEPACAYKYHNPPDEETKKMMFQVMHQEIKDFAEFLRMKFFQI